MKKAPEFFSGAFKGCSNKSNNEKSILSRSILAKKHFSDVSISMTHRKLESLINRKIILY
ncbi:hypothetical protein [Nonlabens antarcticus]|uniref:hypothetical protein n=1 Tax=Nonlabens antarcticus TaxID=392714 RepID=UPI001891B88A|nr:hypothetical protein [Nonlabens antarcticus]